MADSIAKARIKSGLIAEKSIEGRTCDNSNHLTPTIVQRVFDIENPLFTLSANSVADKRGSIIPRKVSINTKGHPYREARLIDFNNSPSRQWFVQFYVWDIARKKLVRKRVGKKELNRIHSLDERREFAEAEIKNINSILKEQGGHTSTKSKRKPEIRPFDFHGHRLTAALEWLYNFEKDFAKANTLAKFKYLKNTVEDFLKSEEVTDILLRQVNTTFAHRFSEHLMKKGIGNRTHNYLMQSLRTAINKLRDKDENLFPNKNPIKIKKLSVVKETHAAYSIQQLNMFTKAIGKKDAQLLLFIRFIYYTLARPKEIRLIKVGHIRMDIKRILMIGSDAKTKIEKYIAISDEFARIIKASGVLKHPAEHYVFSTKGVPGLVPTGKNYFYKRFKVYMDDMGLKNVNNRYTLYSFKHTGAVQLYLATKDAALVQKQCRHTTLVQTQTYLQELGQFTDFNGLEKWKGF